MIFTVWEQACLFQMDDHRATGSSGQWTTQLSGTEKHKHPLHKMQKRKQTHQFQNERWHKWKPHEALNTTLMQNELRNQRQLTGILQYVIWEHRGNLLHQLLAHFWQGFYLDFLHLTREDNLQPGERSTTSAMSWQKSKKLRVYLISGYHIPTINQSINFVNQLP